MTPPTLPPLETQDAALDVGGSTGWADLVVAYSDGGTTTSCQVDLEPCGQPSSGCAADPVLGPADGQGFALGPGGTLLVGFRCAFIRAHGAGQPDFTIWAEIAAGASAIAEVSADGTVFQAVDPFVQSNQSFSLARAGADQARFVRISGGSSSLLIDAVEAL